LSWQCTSSIREPNRSDRSWAACDPPLAWPTRLNQLADTEFSIANLPSSCCRGCPTAHSDGRSDHLRHLFARPHSSLHSTRMLPLPLPPLLLLQPQG
jgi:hypothetical protein